MCSQVFLQTGVLGVLCSAAVGAGNPKLAGVYLQVSYAVLLPVLVMVALCWWWTDRLWLQLGTEPTLAGMAGYYARVLLVSLPIQLIMNQLRQFFSSQMILHPEANAAVVGLVGNLVFGLVFVLGFPFSDWSGYGFVACPWVTTSVAFLQCFFFVGVYCICKRLHQEAWDGWDWSALTWQRIHRYIDLYLPAALATASDFWRVAVIGLVAARLGPGEVAVFNTSYRIMWIVLILVSALSSAAGIQTTTRLGKMDVKGAEQAAMVGIYLSAVVACVIGMFVYVKMEWFGRIFTSDQDLLDLFSASRLPLAITLVAMNMSVALEKVPYSMGRTREVFWYGFLASWVFQVPGVYFCTYHWRFSIFGVFSGMAIGYTALMFIYGTIVVTSDWERYAVEARERSEMPVKKSDSVENP